MYEINVSISWKVINVGVDEVVIKYCLGELKNMFI